MRAGKKLLAAVGLIALLLTLLTQTAWAVDHGYGYWQLTENQKYLYDLMAEYTADGASRIPVEESRGITQDDAQLAMILFTSDYPEYSWLGKKLGERIYYFDIFTSDDVVVILEPCYNSGVSTPLSALQSAAQTALSAIPAAQSEYDKALYLHDYLAQHVRYSYGSSMDDMTAYGALVRGSAVCTGYARAYQYLLQKAGITAWTVMGTATDKGVTEEHAWNVVCLDGAWCYIDVTWDDAGDVVTHDYFGLTLAQMSADHTLGWPYSGMQPISSTPAQPELIPEEPAAAESAPEEPEQPEQTEEQSEQTEEPQEVSSEEPETPQMPVTAETETDTPEEPEQNRTALWCGIAAGAAALIAAPIVLLRRRNGKKEKINEE